MPEPTIATTLDQLSAPLLGVPIHHPNGQTVTVQLRTLSEEQIWTIRKSVKWPVPPVKDYKKTGGQVLPVPDVDNPDYQLAVDEANRDYAYRVLIASLVLEIPGETEAEKVNSLKNTLGRKAFNLLTNAVTRLNSVTEEEIAALAASFRSNGRARSSVTTAAGIDAERVAYTAEGGES